MRLLVRRPQDASRWLLTYADVITLLLAFFTVMYVTSRMDAKRYESAAAAIRKAFRTSLPLILPRPAEAPEPQATVRDPSLLLLQQVVGELEDDLDAGRVQIDRTREAVIVRFPDAILFERGSAEIRDEARTLLGKVGDLIRTLPNAIEAEGHSDTLPIRSGQYPSNWELSVARATAVVRYLVETQGISPLRLSARGLGEHRPLFPNDPDLGEPRNRRVEIRLLIHREETR